MFGPRSPRYPLLKAYLATRARTPRPKPADRAGLGTVALSGAIFAAVAPFAHEPFLMPLGLAVAGGFGLAALRAKPPLPPTAEQELALRADAVVRGIGSQIEWNRLHRAFHPGVTATLEECAGYHARVVAALEGGGWGGRDELRESALVAAKVAMDEAIVHAGETLPYAPPTRPLDQISDTLEDIGFGSLTRGGEHEPMPASFRPVRELAERLRELAVRCETAAVQGREESSEPVSAAFRRLDAALGEMRHLEEAEGELRQGA